MQIWREYNMNKINKKNILILICFVIIIILEIKAFTDSKAEKIINIMLNINDSEKVISEQNIELQVIEDTNNEISILLPEVVNNKKIEKYIIERTEKNKINENENKQKDLNNNLEDDNDIQQNNTILDKTTTNIIEEKKAGEKLKLTEDEIKEKKVTVNVVYDKIGENNQILYNTILKDKNGRIEISGYLPNEIRMDVKEKDISNIKNKINNNFSNFSIERKL